MTGARRNGGLKIFFYNTLFFSNFLDTRGQNLPRCGSKDDWNRTLSHAVPHDWFWRPYYDVIAQISKFRRSMAYDMSTEMPWSTELISGSRVPYKLGGHHLWFWWRHYDVIMKFSHFHRNIACNMSKKRYLNRTYRFCLNRGEIRQVAHHEWLMMTSYGLYCQYILIIALSVFWVFGQFIQVTKVTWGHQRSSRSPKVTIGHRGQKGHQGQKCIFKRNFAIISSFYDFGDVISVVYTVIHIYYTCICV